MPSRRADLEREEGGEDGAGGCGGRRSGAGGPGAAFALEPLAHDDVGVGGAVVDHAPARHGLRFLRLRHHVLQPDAFFGLEPDASAQADLVGFEEAVLGEGAVGADAAEEGVRAGAEAEGAAGAGFAAPGGDEAGGVQGVEVVVAEGEGDDGCVLEGGDDGGLGERAGG